MALIVQCDWPGCDFQATIATNLKIHRMRAHTGEKPEKCPQPGCTYAAVRKFELKVHMVCLHVIGLGLEESIALVALLGRLRAVLAPIYCHKSYILLFRMKG